MVSAWVVAVLVSEDKEKTVEALSLLECLLRNVPLHLNPHFLLTKLVTWPSLTFLGTDFQAWALVHLDFI